MVELNTCKKCGIGFIPKRRTQKYCNDTCRTAYYEAHYFIKKQETKTCPNCGTPFVTTKPKLQVYCTPGCREEAKLKRLELLEKGSQ